MKYIMIVLALMCLSMVGCKKVHRNPNQGQINYIRDTRTNLCFAYYQQYSRFSMSNVPCSALKNVHVKDCYSLEQAQ
jgi:hypothetical protein